MAWSQIVCFGSRWDRSSLKTLLCLAYSCGIFVLSVSWAAPIIALQSSIRSIWAGHGLFTVHGINCALAASEVLNMIGSCVRKNLILVLVDPVRMARSV